MLRNFVSARKEAADKVAGSVLNILNGAHAAALQDVVDDMFVCCSRVKELAFWSAGDVKPTHLGSPSQTDQRPGKVVYVDDLGLMLPAATPGASKRSCCTCLAKTRGN